MSKAARLFILGLCALLILWGTAAQAEMVTVGITLTGILPADDGTFRTVTAEGSFRVYQNGQEIGTIEAGRNTLTASSTERIRIEPIPQTFAPEWDLSTAYQHITLSGGGAQMIPVTVALKTEATETPVPETVPTETPAPEPGTESKPAENTAGTELPGTETQPPVIQTPHPATQAPIQTPTLPPYTPETLTTPEPVLQGLPEGNETGSLRVQVFFDKNGNGNQGNYEYGVSGIRVYLLNESGEALVSTETDGDGFAVFGNVPEGRYQTRIVLPEEWYFTQYGGENSLILSAYRMSAESSQSSSLMWITSGEEAQQGAAIHNNASSMSGFCWLEDEVDGLYRENETKVAGVRIRLKYRDEDLAYETTTNEDGSWKIDHLRPGYYTLSVSGPAGTMLTRYTQSRGKRSYLTSDNPRRLVEATGEDKSDMNIGFNWASQIHGVCYLDANYNGVYDEGELPLSGVRLSVRYTYDNAEASSAVSGADGSFLLDGLRGNQYLIQAVLPDDGSVYTRTAPESTLGNLFAPRGDRRDQTLRNVVLADAERREMNLGAIYPATVSGTVYYDDNFSAAREEKEKTVSGFQVVIRDPQGNIAATDRTNVNGVYQLTGLTPGEYTLEVKAVSGYAFTKLGEGNSILNRNNGEGYSEPFRVELGEKITGKNIGMIRPGTVKGTVFADRNDNGTRENGENGLQGVIVRLMSETEGEAFRTEIGADGSFLFDAVMPGRYYVEYLLPERAVFARTAVGGNQMAGEGSTGRTDSFGFVTGQVLEAPLCGALTLGRIDGTAYRDHDGNGLMENEEALAGMTLKLIPSRNELEEITVQTGTDGSFILDDLRPDTYQMELICPDGTVVSRTDKLSLPLKAGQEKQAVPLDVPMGAEWRNQKIGAVAPAGIRGRLWLDENNNGLFDEGERTPAGFRITVTDEATGTVFDVIETDEQGGFAATGMIPGSFTVSMPTDSRTLAPKAGDSDFREENGALALSGIQLKENETREGLLMGVVRTTVISGHAWIDRGGMTETLGGVKILMKDPAGNLIASAETDSNGDYLLENLMPGQFILDVTAPEGCVIIEPGDQRLSAGLNSVIMHPVNRQGSTDVLELRMDQDMNRMDIGCVLPGRLGDYCWADLNMDGLQAGNEPGIPNVRIELQRDGATIAETVTDQYGFYRFVDLYPATYILKVTAPPEVKPTLHRTDLPMINSVLEETEEAVSYSVPVTVESDRSFYDADLGFISRKKGVLPAGTGEGETQNWIPKY